MKIRNTFYRNDDGNGGGGATVLPPSIKDLEDVSSGDGTPVLPDLGNVIEGLNPDGTLQDGYELGADGKTPQKKEAGSSAPVEGLNDKGELLPGYKKDEQGNVVKDPEYKDDDNDGDDDPGNEDPNAFFEDVAKITGIKVEVEYPEGVDPLTPEGVAIRDKVIADTAAINYEDYLMKTHPRAYALMLHLEAGGTEEEFFSDDSAPAISLPTLEELRASPELQGKLYKQDLLSRGVSEKIAQMELEEAIKDNTLLSKSEAVHKSADELQKKQLKELENKNKKAQEEYKKQEDAVLGSLDKLITDGLAFVVPEAKKEEFKSFVVNNLRYVDGKFLVMQELGTDSADMKKQIEALFFQYANGDLSGVIQRTAKKQASQKLRRTVQQAADDKQKNQGDGKQPELPLSLQELPWGSK